jgi:hypothetical protein
MQIHAAVTLISSMDRVIIDVTKRRSTFVPDPPEAI